MIAIQLARQAKEAGQGILIRVFDKGANPGRGIAYKTYSDKHLLNVSAGNMSAFPDEMNHFVEWLKDHSGLPASEVSNVKFYPRNLYGDYLNSLLENELLRNDENVKIELIRDEVIDLKINNGKLTLTCKKGTNQACDFLVLASGNQLPSEIRTTDGIVDPALTRYSGNPWEESCVSGLDPDKNIMIAGTGLTMIDAVIGIHEKGFKGIIYAVSPKGFLMLPHRKKQEFPEFENEIRPPYELSDLFRTFRKHVKKAQSEGISAIGLVDSLRKHTQEIWRKLSVQEKRRFMRHLRHLWGVARHRLPQDQHEFIEQLIQDGKLKVIAGRIRNVTNSDKEIIITLRQRFTQAEMLLPVQRLINCTGPETNPVKFKSAFFINLLEKKVILCDEMNMGLQTVSGGMLVTKESLKGRIFATGSLLKGSLWESTAVPELRTQAKDTAKSILTKVLSQHKSADFSAGR
ncbi:MAG: hypothetical protein DWQ44_11080 [Bacteroidetes bacterium]|nr:MAG: hypothetical protein DWQ33_09200 [Bacteroidota bacterium]REK05172.1 MAG: hypothetical protein DWQ39_08210 [Bacteroidota bacterium]REK32577.1 MAG: hypothetical protein DWQ44_11080 [Bacteroidota bacterium]REK48976.1 MAG: hypothetical protein DWQ48_08880 [Bacteroidota bacterium]